MSDIAVATPLPSAPARAVDEPRGPKPKKFFTPSRIVIYSILVMASIYYLFPLYVMITTSLKPMSEIRFGSIFALPEAPTFDYWVRAWSSACTGLKCEGLSPGFWNSVKITIPSVIASILIASVNGYALVNWKFRGSEVFFAILIFGSFIPYQVMLYPLVMITSQMKIFGSLWAIILIHTIFGMPILTLLFRNYFAALPEELFKAARVDGAGFWRIYGEVMLPMSLPIFVVALILQITGIWNDFLFGVVFAGFQNYPMTVQLNNIVNTNQGSPEYNVNMASTILTGLVPLIVYFVSGPLFVRGVAAGAVKG